MTVAANNISTMKTQIKGLLAVAVCLGLFSARAQMGGMGMGRGPGAQFITAIGKLFGDNSAFSASIEAKTMSPGEGMEVTIPVKVAYDTGKLRVDVEMSQMKGLPLPPEMVQKIKESGLDKTSLIMRPDKKTTATIYPGLKAYSESTMDDTETSKSDGAYKLTKTEAGKETIDGHPCVKNKCTITDDKGKKHEFTTWNATDLKEFPVRIDFAESGNTVSLGFKGIKLAKPDAAQFEAPADFKKYDEAQMQQELMKRMMGAMGGGPGGPGGGQQ
jgi:hypothetical protein